MYREKIFGVLAKIEATSGVDAAPDPAVDAVRVVGIPTLTMGFLEQGERDDVQTGQLIVPTRTDAAGRFGKIDITLEAKGSGAAGTAPPELDPFLRASGFSKTVTVGTSVLYATLDEAPETLTLWCYGAGKVFKLVGCVCTLKLSADATKRGQFVFSVTGKMAADPAEAALPTLSFASVLPPLFHSATASIGTWTSADVSNPLVLKSASLDLQNAITERASAGATDGLIGYVITDRKVRQTMVVEVPPIAAFDAFALAKATGSGQPVSVWQIGTAAGNRLKVQTGKWSQIAPQLGAQNGISTMTLQGGLGPGAPTSARELNLLFD